MYLGTTDAALQRRYVSGMAASRDPALLGALMAMSMNASMVRPTDTTSILQSVAANAVGRAAAWAFVQASWPELYKRYGSGGFALSGLVYGTTAPLTSAASLASVQAFFAANPAPAAALDIAQAQEMIASQAAWSAADRAATCAWLQQQAQ